MGEGYWVVRTYEAGAVGEKTKFFIPGARPTKSQRRERQEIRKQEQNEYSAMKNLARLINANFGPGDLLLGLDYSEEGLGRVKAYAEEHPFQAEEGLEGEDYQREQVRRGAEREVKLCLRRVKRELAEQGISLPYIFITSDMDGDTGEAVRVHHHLIVPAAAREAFLKKWSLGGVSWSVLADQADYTPIAEYFIRQVRHVPDAKKYVTSRNLIRPRPKDRVALSDAEIRTPKGCQLLFRSEFKPGRPQYIRYVLPEEKQRRRKRE